MYYSQEKVLELLHSSNEMKQSPSHTNGMSSQTNPHDTEVNVRVGWNMIIVSTNVASDHCIL